MYPLYRHLVAKSGTKLGVVDLSSDAPHWRYLVAKCGTKLGPVDLGSYALPVEVSSGQEWYKVGSS